MDELKDNRRIVVLGKTGAGKSSLANTIFGEKLFLINHTLNSESTKCQVKTKSINGRRITLIDSPGFFDPGRSEEDLKSDILKCVTECAPGPHAFLIVLKVEKFTQQEKEVIEKICQHFSEDALKYAAVVFTHGDQLSEGMKIEEFVTQNEGLGDLVRKCGGRCHVVDNKYWKDNKEDDYRNNQFQVAQILKTIDKINEANEGSCYTNEMLQEVKRDIQREQEQIRQSSGNMSLEEIRNRAIMNVSENILIRLTGLATGVLLGALFGVAEMVTTMVVNLQVPSNSTALASTARTTLASAALRGGVRGSQIGYDAAEGAENPTEAVQRAARAMWDSARSGFRVGAASDQNSK